jgi:UDP-N-acetyl-D-galactosamine dehydrogenase
VDELQKGHDRTLEVEDSQPQNVLIKTYLELEEKGKGLLVTDAIGPISSANIYIVTVPTPTDKHNRPVDVKSVLEKEKVDARL